MRRLILLTLLLCGLTGLSQVEPPPVAQAQDPASEILNLVNGFRAELGLPPFTYNPTLASAAQQQANYMAETGLYSHTGYNGSSPQTRAEALGYNGYVVENIVGGTNLTPRQGLTWWINSPVHYNTLVTTRHVEAGTGYAYGGGQHRFALVVGHQTGQAPSSGRRTTEPQPAPIIVEPIVLAEPGEDGSIVHRVGRGQALWSLAAHYDVPLADLMLYNNLTETSFLRIGDEIIIRLGEGQEPPPTPTPPTTHIVREGQTLWTIAAIYNLKLSDLLYLNSLPEDAFITPGQELVIRLLPGQAPPPTATPQLSVFVSDGDTYWSIAARHGLTVEELLTLNNLAENSFLQPGQELLIRPPDPTPAPPTETPTLPPPPTSTPEVIDVGLVTPAAEVEVALVATAVPSTTPTPAPDTPNTATRTATSPTTWLLSLAGMLAVAGIFVLWRTAR